MIKNLLNQLKNSKTNCSINCEEINKLKEENQKLQAENKNLEEETQKMKGIISEKDAVIDSLKGQLRKMVKEQFDISSEKEKYLNPNEEGTDETGTEKDNASSESSEKPSNENQNNNNQDENNAKKSRKIHPHGRIIPENLPEIVIYHRRPIEELTCPITGKLLYRETTLTEDSVEIDIEIKMVKIIHKRVIYSRIEDEEDTRPAMIVAQKPESIIYKSLYSTKLWVLLLVVKFFAQVPIYRQINNIWGQYGTYFNDSTITGGFKKLGEYLIPLYKQFIVESRKDKHWHADETRWKVFVDPLGKKTFNWWMWVFASSKVFVYVIDRTRSSKVPKEHFGENASGIINVDRYAGYLILVGMIQRALCWYHVRRDFVKAFISFSELKEWASVWRSRIRTLEKINDARVAVINNIKEFSKQQILLENQLKDMKDICNKELEDASIKTKQKKVLESLMRNWAGLTVFVSNPLVPMHNNFSERALRLLALGRNNYYGSRSEWSAQLAAMCMSICKTAELHGLNPQAYIEFYFNICAKNDSRIPNDITSLLPWNLSSEVIDKHKLRSNDSRIINDSA
jgi:transposase